MLESLLVFQSPLELCAEASCKSQVETARAVVADVGKERSSKCGIDLWAACALQNRERDTHRVIKRQGQRLDLEIRVMKVRDEEIPYIPPRAHVEWLLRHGLRPRLAGLGPNEHSCSETVWRQFWQKYQMLHPAFEVFNVREPHELGRTAALCVHGDEGRSLKKQGLMVTCLQSMLGQGFDNSRVPKSDEDGIWHLRVNFSGHSYTHRFLLSCMPKYLYDSRPEIFHEVMENLVLELKSLQDDGVVDPVSGLVHYVTVVAVKGDAPYLAKVGRFYRSYNTTAKRGDERQAPKGVCHRCLAGCQGFRAEELSSKNPAWVATRGVKLPWVHTPSFLKHLVHDVSDPASYFCTDVWHVVHLGFGRSWIASCVFLLLEVLPQPNLDAKWEFLTLDYKRWCRQAQRQSHVGAISAYMMSYNDKAGLMGNWHKGAVTTNLLKWLPDLISRFPDDRKKRLQTCKRACIAMNLFFSTLYRADAFLSQIEANLVADCGFFFLRTYAAMARDLYSEGQQAVFPLYPKCHAFHEIVWEAWTDARRTGFSMNPLVYSCQIDEDMVGKTSRVSRRVSARKVIQRTLERYLVGAKTSWEKEGLIA